MAGFPRQRGQAPPDSASGPYSPSASRYSKQQLAYDLSSFKFKDPRKRLWLAPEMVNSGSPRGYRHGYWVLTEVSRGLAGHRVVRGRESVRAGQPFSFLS